MTASTGRAEVEAAAIVEAAHALAALWPRTLAVAVHPAVVRAGTIGRTADVHGLPGGVTVHTIRREVRDTAWTLVEVVDDVAGLTIAVGSVDVVAMLDRVATHADALAVATTGPDPAAEVPPCRTHGAPHPGVSDLLGCLVHRARTYVEPPGAREFLGPCPGRVDANPGGVCGEDLRAYPGEAGRCTAGHVVDAPTARRAALAGASTRLLTLAQVSTLAPRLWDRPVPVDALERAVRDGRLLTTRTPTGTHLVRVPDVAALVATMRAPRRRLA